MYEECGYHIMQHCTRSSFFYSPANGLTSLEVFFSLEPFATQGKNHSSKFQLIRICRFGGVWEQTNTQTHSLTDVLLLQLIFKVKQLPYRYSSTSQKDFKIGYFYTSFLSLSIFSNTIYVCMEQKSQTNLAEFFLLAQSWSGFIDIFPIFNHKIYDTNLFNFCFEKKRKYNVTKSVTQRHFRLEEQSILQSLISIYLSIHLSIYLSSNIRK